MRTIGQSIITMAGKVYLFATSLILAIAAVSVFTGARSAAFDSSSRFSQALQEASHPAVDVMFFVIAYSSLALTGLIVVVAYVEFHPIPGLVLASLTAVAVCCSDLLKLAFSDPRPYWAYEHVKAITCDKGWGTPSGHAMLTGTIWGWLFFQMWRAGWKKRSSIPIFGLLAIGLDRVYLGVHFYSQVILGWAFAFVLISFVNMNYQRITSGLAVMRTWWLVCGHAFALGLYTLVVVLYVSVEPEWNSEWTMEIGKKCGVDITEEETAARELVEGTIILLLPGALLGYKLLQNSGVKEWWGGRLSYRRIFRILLSCLPLLSFQLVNWTALKFIPSAGAAAVTGLTSYISGIALTYGVPVISHRFHLNREPIRVQQVSLQLIETKPMTLAGLIAEFE